MRYGLTDEKGVFRYQNMKVTLTGTSNRGWGGTTWSEHGRLRCKEMPENQNTCLDLIDRPKDMPHVSCIRRLVEGE